jgi:hypothetical protein
MARTPAVMTEKKGAPDFQSHFYAGTPRPLPQLATIGAQPFRIKKGR